jgi:hypothetical protein
VRTVRLSLSHTVLAAVIAVLVAPVPGRAYSITSFEWNERVTLKLVDGRRLEGNFHGVLGPPVETSDYETRYSAWREELGSTSAPMLGETLLVARGKLASVRGAFRGFADGALLLGSPDSCVLLVLPIHDGTDMRRVDEPSMDSSWIAARPLWKRAPAPRVLVLRNEDGTIAVPESKIATRKSGHDAASAAVAGVLLGLVIGAVVAAAAYASALSQSTF